MELIAHFINNYSDNFIVALALWPLASGVLSVPLIALLYHRDGRMHLNTVIGAYLSVLYALSLVCFTLYPLPSGESGLGITYGIAPQLNPFGFLNDLAKDGIGAIPQIFANIAFFVPLGFIAGRLLRAPLFHSLILGLVISLLIEIAQLTGLFFLYPYSYRTFDVCDLLWNTSGTALGWALYLASEKVLPSRIVQEKTLTHNPGFVRRVIAFCLDMTFVVTLSTAAGVGVQVAYALLGFDSNNGVTAATNVSLVVGCLALLFTQGVFPWLHHGSTLGGKFVRMSFETAPRSEILRMVFYGLRLVVIAGALQVSFIAFPLLALFYMIKHCMPYDLLPCESNYQKYKEHLKAHGQNAPQSGSLFL